MKKTSDFPPGWDEERVRRVINHCESQTEDEAVAEDEAAFEDPGQTVMLIPNELVPAVRELLAKHTC
jgi:hypothetical protein